MKKKTIQKRIAVFLFFTLLVQGVLLNVGTALADRWGADDPNTGIATSGPVVQQVQTNQQEAGKNTPSTGDETAKPNTGGGLIGAVIDGFLWVIKWVLLQIRDFIYLIIASPAAAGFAWVTNPANISGPTGVLNIPAVYELWQFIRDFFNLFFILILLYSAFCTIFQVDSFNIRTVFKNVLLVALLINFSFPITRLLIDMANVPMYYFINDVIGNGTGQGGMIAMQNLLGASGIAAGSQAVVGENNNIVQLLMSIVYAFLFSISLMVLSVMLIIRLIALVLLLIFSPVGFASSLLPGSYGSQWWSKFWSYALFGPAAALMLVVSLKFLASAGSAFQSIQAASTNISVNPSGATAIAQMVFFAIPIILIWTTIGLAQTFSIAGAATVTGAGYGVANWTRKKIQGGAWGGTKLIAKNIDKSLAKSKRFNILSVGALKQGWKERSARKEREAYQASGAVGDQHDRLNTLMAKVNVFSPSKFKKAWSGKLERTDYGHQMRQSERAKYQKEQLDKTGGNTDEAVDETVKNFKNGENIKFQAGVMNLAAGKDLNDFQIALAKLGKEMGGEIGAKLEAVGGHYDITELRGALVEMFKSTGADEQTAYRQVRAVSDTALAAGNIAAAGMIATDSDTGLLRLSTEDEWDAKVVEKYTAMDPQERVRKMHENSLFTQGLEDVSDEQGNAVYKTEIDEQGKTVYQKKKDEKGNVVYQKKKDEQGNETEEFELDEQGEKIAEKVREQRFVNKDLHKRGAALAMAMQKSDVEQIGRMNDKLRLALVQVGRRKEATHFQEGIKANPELKELVKKASQKSSDEQQTFVTTDDYVKKGKVVYTRSSTPPNEPYLPGGAKADIEQDKAAERERKRQEKKAEAEEEETPAEKWKREKQERDDRAARARNK